MRAPRSACRSAKCRRRRAGAPANLGDGRAARSGDVESATRRAAQGRDRVGGARADGHRIEREGQRVDLRRIGCAARSCARRAPRASPRARSRRGWCTCRERRGAERDASVTSKRALAHPGGARSLTATDASHSQVQLVPHLRPLQQVSPSSFEHACPRAAQHRASAVTLPQHADVLRMSTGSPGQRHSALS